MQPLPEKELQNASGICNREADDRVAIFVHYLNVNEPQRANETFGPSYVYRHLREMSQNNYIPGTLRHINVRLPNLWITCGLKSPYWAFPTTRYHGAQYSRAHEESMSRDGVPAEIFLTQPPPDTRDTLYRGPPYHNMWLRQELPRDGVTAPALQTGLFYTPRPDQPYKITLDHLLAVFGEIGGDISNTELTSASKHPEDALLSDT